MNLTRRMFSMLLASVAMSPLLIHAEETARPIRIGIVGMTHGHVNGFLRRGGLTHFELAGICEPDQAVVEKYRERYDLPADLFYSNLNTFLEETRPEAVWAFNSTKEHLEVVEACAPRGIHVVVEKPLAVDLASARKMAELSRKHDVFVLTNLETSWFPSFHEAYRIAVTEQQLGPITRIVSHFGHPGPAEINVPPEFFKWLTDPELNGGGASADFGCYGGNLSTWLMNNERPLSVTAVFQTNKPDVYPNVDDNATLILEYRHAQSIVQASWDWTFSRKDLHIYGRKGVLRTIDTKRYDLRLERKNDPAMNIVTETPTPHESSVVYFDAVLRGKVDPAGGLSSLENNLIATEILEAARRSAQTGKTIRLPLEPAE
uniref:Oxidoreductase domain protein n=2 Tax=Rubinisphaera brasiliensis TaxID=119 RepID=F0SJN2_RUBBR|nr:oxidoreductase domain protein [Rubinisphaera brasiliensis DSM 5305]